MRFGHVSAPYWNKESVVYLLGGGPSLIGFDFGRLRGKVVVAVNDAVYNYDAPSAVVSVDSTWIDSNASLLRLSGFRGEVALGMLDGRQPLPKGAEQLQDDNISLMEWRQAPGLSLDAWVLNSPSTSGYAALNYAVLKGAKRIVLLGYDYCQPGEHWFGRYPWQSGADETIWGLWAEQYNSTLPILKRLGVEVWNGNLNSRVRAFPFLDREFDFR